MLKSAVRHGDCLDVLPTLAAGSVDAVVTDPPYGLEFMGKDWDRLTRNWMEPQGEADQRWNDSHSEADTPGTKDGMPRRMRNRPDIGGSLKHAPQMQAWHRQWAAAALRVLRPGGYLLAFGGTRTWHRLACALEDAGFEMRDTLMWLHGQGFPKGKGCLKPAWEPVLLCRRPGKRVLPMPGLDGCRVPTQPERPGSTPPSSVNGRRGCMAGPLERVAYDDSKGRWPANLVLSCACPEGGPHSGACPVRLLDGQSGERRAGKGKRDTRPTQANGNCYGLNAYPNRHRSGEHYGDTGGASRFFYCAKASRAEREAGLEGMPQQAEYGYDNGDGLSGRTQLPDGTWTNTGIERREPRANTHPTVKPLALMRWLVRLVTPPGGLCLDPFLGSGTTAVACALEGLRCVGIEREAEYVAIARRRVAAAVSNLLRTRVE